MDRSEQRRRALRVAKVFFVVDLLLRLVSGPGLQKIEPSISTGHIFVFLFPCCALGWAAMYWTAVPLRRWLRAGGSTPDTVAAAIRSARHAPAQIGAIYAASYVIPCVLALATSTGFDYATILFAGCPLFGPLPFGYSYATKFISLLAPGLEEDAQAHGLAAPLNRSIRGRMLVMGFSMTMYPTMFVGSIAVHSQGTGDLSLLPMAFVGVAIYGFACASMLAADFLVAHTQLAQLNRSLEHRVAERTSVLAATNEKLASEMQSRLAMEVELRQANKLEAVGRLAAGVAHEINSPVQYATDSLEFIKGAYADISTLLTSHLELVQLAKSSSDSRCREGATSATEIFETTDAGYLLAELPLSVERGLEGLARVTKIVRSMNQFAYADGEEMATVELNEAIASTLTMCNNEIKYVADLVTTFGDLPPVRCFVGEINQLVLNLVVNAAHAITDQVKGTDRRGKISISTSAESDSVLISIADTGGGIPAEIRDRIFEPFFTTKEVGRGLGQGLAIARAVAHKHRGALDFETNEGVGTTFRLRLPLAA